MLKTITNVRERRQLYGSVGLCSYFQSDSYLIEIDALSTNNRPITSTLDIRSNYNAYENQMEDETSSYDIYDNQEFNNKSNFDSYKNYRKSSAAMANSDNLMYHRDACSGDSSDRYDMYTTYDYDSLKGEFHNYGLLNESEGYEQPCATQGDSNNKLLPQISKYQNSINTWRGMYSCDQQRQTNVSISSTPSFHYNCGGSVDGRDISFNNGDWGRKMSNGGNTKWNGYGYYDHNSEDLYEDNTPDRLLPSPQSQTYVNRSLKKNFFQDKSDSMSTNTTMSAYQNPINFDNRVLPVSVNQNLSSQNLYFNNDSNTEPRLSSNEIDYNNTFNTYDTRYAIESSPHAAMQTTDEFNNFGLILQDNLSTYSDTKITNGSIKYASQQKMQDLRKYRYSIIMAMTTASVIASGETRIPQQLLKKAIKPMTTVTVDTSTTNGPLKMNSNEDMTAINSSSYIVSSSFLCTDSNKKSYSSGSNNLTLCAYTNTAVIPNQSPAALSHLTLASETSNSMLMLSSASPIVNGSVPSTAISTNDLLLAKNLTSRKLPKHHTDCSLKISKQLPQSPQNTLTHSTASGKILPTVPKTKSLRITTLDDINVTSSISTPTSILPSETVVLTPLSPYQGTCLASSSFPTTATKIDYTITSSLTTSTTTDLLPSNNNNMNIGMKKFDSFNNNNVNFFANNSINTDEKSSIESIDKEKQTEEQHEFMYHSSTTPSSSSTTFKDSLSPQQNRKKMAYDPIITYISSITERTTSFHTGTMTTSSIAQTTTSSITAYQTVPITTCDYKIVCNSPYDNKLTPYTLSTTINTSSYGTPQFTLPYHSSNISSSYSSYPSIDINSDYLPFSSLKTTDSSTTLTSSCTSSSTSISEISTATTSTILAINNSGLNNIITGLNLSDNNIRRKYSISSPFAKVASSSDSIVPVTSMPYYTTTTLTSNGQMTTATTSSSLNSLTPYIDHLSTSITAPIVPQDYEEGENKRKSWLPMGTDSKESSLYKDYYDNYVKDYELNFISPLLTTTTLSPIAHTTATAAIALGTSTSSSSLNKSWSINTMTATSTITTKSLKANDNIFKNQLNNNEVVDIKTSVTCKPDCLLILTKDTAPATEFMPTSTKDSLTTTAAALTPDLYTDYLNDYKTTSNSFPSEITDKSQHDVPAYIKDFLITYKSEELNSSKYLNLYKINEEDTAIDDSAFEISSVNTTSINNIKSATTLPSTKEAAGFSGKETTETILPVLLSPKIEEQPADNTGLMAVDFDDSFYNGFSVNLNSLIVETTDVIYRNSTLTECTGLTTNANTTLLQSNISNLKESLSKDIGRNFSTSTSAPTTISAATSSTASPTSAPSIMQSSVTSLKSLPSTNQKPIIVGVKASSMFGGLSQSLIGGLDSVLDAAGGSKEKQPHKRGFGFSLASKFVPSVGGLLGSTAKYTAPSTETTAESPKTVIALSTISQNLQIIDPHNKENPTTATTNTTSNNLEATTIYDGYFHDIASSDEGIAKSFNETLGASDNLYNNSSQPIYYHMTSSHEYLQEDISIYSDQMILYDDDEAIGDVSVMSKDRYADDNQALDMYGGYSEYESNAASGHFIEEIYPTSCTTALISEVSTSATIASNIVQSKSSTIVTETKKPTRSLFSSVSNAVVSQISQQTSTAITTVSSIPRSSTNIKGSSGGMFGSIFGKAAAAIQTATQVGTQATSMASTKVQHNFPPFSAVAVSKPEAVRETTTTRADAIVAAKENNNQRTVIARQDSLASPCTSSLGCDDYDNSNIPGNPDGDVINNYSGEDEYFYENLNQQSHQHINQPSQQKFLPAVPTGSGSTGKKLPTISDKSGCLMKQETTEIYDENTKVLQNKSQPVTKCPTYESDSEQSDYYLDTQPMATPLRHVVANGSYEQTNQNIYDYQDDFFNEEDELKYLEKEKILDSKRQILQIHKQSSIQYVVEDDYQDDHNEIMDEYMDTMYHSEDSGNYLDESSSESVKGLTIHQQASSILLQDSHMQPKISTFTISSTTAKTPSISTLHQQIKKQESIAQEEDKKEKLPAIIELSDGASSPVKSLSRKSSYDILGEEDDEMGELRIISSSNQRSSQSRKVKLLRSETEEIVGHIPITKRQTEVTAKQRWHWAYNKIIIQLNVSKSFN